ncbi:sn-glycerol-3-phosphate ABC transporter ATP-binding protein UgpC [Terrarubrum flagellatum]|uniref:sn-glycerol-3-phosphate ABC transporter ATP-binding protein UgpC n=1 Tax=Terrirubrum flagellatum TaxID=2895980 RepID=UPI003144DA06
MAGVTLENVKKVYLGGVEAVKGASLAIPDGSFTVLLGPSGCGKSTLLRMIAGLETITSGAIKIGDRIVNDIEPSDRDIAMVFQNYALYPHMSVYDNMAYGLRNRGVAKEEIERRVAEASRMLAIGEFLTRKPRALSGGQRQRVAMGRAVVREPQAFLFDEPLSNLDAKLRVQMRLEIRRLHQRLKATSIFVTHDQVEAMTLADTVVVMSRGEIQQVGAPTDVYRRPATTFVASFIGSPAMNLMPGRVAGRGVVEIAGAGTLPFNADEFIVQEGDEVEIGVRPEDWGLFASGDGGLTFKREFVEELGATRLVHGLAGDAALVVAIPTGATDPETEEARLVAKASSVHLFSRATGRTLRAA